MKLEADMRPRKKKSTTYLGINLVRNFSEQEELVGGTAILKSGGNRG